MNIFTKVTWKTMKQNRVRTLVTIVGVILSAAMFTAVTTFCSSLMDFCKRSYIYHNGSGHISVESADSLLYAKLYADSDTASFASAEHLGYAVFESKNSEKPYLHVLGADSTFFEQMPVHLTSGRLPETDTELLLPYHLFTNGGFSAEIGSKLTLSLGERTLGGEKLGQNIPFLHDGEEEHNGLEVFTPLTEKTYTVVGIYERPSFEDYNAPGYTVLTRSSGEPLADGEYYLSVILKRPAKTMRAYMERNALDSYDGLWVNWQVLMFSGVWQYDNFIPFVGGMAFIACILILLGSVVMIYSVFSISVSERTKQFGLLASVGATKRQIRRCVLAEAGIVSAAGIPLGLLSGIAGMGVTLALVGDKFRNMLSSPYAMRLWVSVPAVVAAALVTLFTVLLSVWIPSRRATKITAIEAIRQSREITTGNRQVKMSKPAYRLFGLEGMLAKKYFKRSKKKYRTTVISLTLSIVLFVSSSVFGSGLSSSVSGSANVSDVDVVYYPDDMVELPELAQCFSQVEGIQEMTYSTRRSGGIVLDEEKLTKEYREYIEKFPLSLMEEMEEPVKMEYIHYVEDGVYDRLAGQCGIPEEVCASENPPAVVLNRRQFTVYYTEMNGEANRLSYDMQMLRTEVSEIEIVDIYTETLEKSLAQIGGKTEEKPFGIGDFEGRGDGILMIYPERARVPEERDVTKFYFKASDYDTMIRGIEQVIKENTWSDEGLMDYVAMQKEQKDMVTLAKVFSYGFISLLSLISVVNVFHTISTNIALRRRDFAMLRSVGMSKKGLLRMMHYECLLYGSKALMYGLPLSALMAALIHNVTTNVYESGFTLPWVPMGIASLSVFAVVFVTMLYSMRKIKKENPMDSLKNENI